MLSPDADSLGDSARVPAAHPPSSGAGATGAPAAVAGSLLPERSSEETDAAWGEHPEPADDRLYRDRPPHWADF